MDHWTSKTHKARIIPSSRPHTIIFVPHARITNHDTDMASHRKNATGLSNNFKTLPAPAKYAYRFFQGTCIAQPSVS